jgi:translocator protein
MTQKLSVKIALSIITCVGLGLASGFSTIQSITDWYPSIQKPSWNPPNWLFGPTWTLLYTMMGIAFAMVWHANHTNKKVALTFFIVQFILNMLWSFLFFNMHDIGIAFAEILIMALLILITIINFFKINKNAAYLLVPYLCWVSFASVLNGTIWMLNR